MKNPKSNQVNMGTYIFLNSKMENTQKKNNGGNDLNEKVYGLITFECFLICKLRIQLL